MPGYIWLCLGGALKLGKANSLGHGTSSVSEHLLAMTITCRCEPEVVSNHIHEAFWGHWRPVVTLRSSLASEHFLDMTSDDFWFYPGGPLRLSIHRCSAVMEFICLLRHSWLSSIITFVHALVLNQKCNVLLKVLLHFSSLKAKVLCSITSVISFSLIIVLWI